MGAAATTAHTRDRAPHPGSLLACRVAALTGVPLRAARLTLAAVLDQPACSGSAAPSTS